MGSASLLSHGVIFGYALGTIAFLAGVLARREDLKKAAVWCAVFGFCLHTVAIGMEFTRYSLVSLPRGYYIQLLSWVLVAIFFILWWRLRMGFLALIASPLALLFYLAAFGMPMSQATMPKSMVQLFFGLHIGSLFIALALLAMAFGAGLVFLSMDRRIKSKEKLKGFQKDLPSLMVFDRVNHWAVLVGFPLFTLGMFSGFFWAKLTWGKLVSWDPKEIASIIIWLVFAYVFHQRVMLGWRGRKPALLAVWLFVGALLSLLVINFFLPTHHSFTA